MRLAELEKTIWQSARVSCMHQPWDQALGGCHYVLETAQGTAKEVAGGFFVLSPILTALGFHQRIKTEWWYSVRFLPVPRFQHG